MRICTAASISLAIFSCLCGAGAAKAQSTWVSEAKLGVLDHDVRIGGDHAEPGIDVNGELLFASPGFLRIIGAPRPHLGGSVNTSGATSYAYAGLTWTATLFGPFYGSLGLGGAVHDGQLDEPVPQRKLFGSRVLFHEYVELGYRMLPAVSVSVFLDHMSNADLARHNAGLTNLGMRTGFSF